MPAPFTFHFTGTLNGEPKSITVSPGAWARVEAGGWLAGARLILRITDPAFIEESVKVDPWETWPTPPKRPKPLTLGGPFRPSFFRRGK